MKVILNNEFFNLLKCTSDGLDAAGFVFYAAGEVISAANGFIDDLDTGSRQHYDIRKISGRIMFLQLCDYELADFDSYGDELVWIIPDTYKPLCSAAHSAESVDSLVAALSSDSKIILNGRVHRSFEIICEHDSTRAATAVSAEHEESGADNRTMLWLGQGNFEKISGARLCCIGAGGLMNPFIVQAAHHGFRSFIIIDADRLEKHNLNRFIGSGPLHEGRHKTAILKEYILNLRPDAEVITMDCMFPEGGTAAAMAGADLIVAGVDNDYTRLLVQVNALAFNRAFFDMGSGIFLEDVNAAAPVVDERGGQVRFFSPGGPCLACMGLDPGEAKSMARREIDIRRGYVAGTDLTPPSVVTINFAVSSLCLDMAVEYLTTGRLDQCHVHYDAAGRRLLDIRESRNEKCPVCGG